MKTAFGNWIKKHQLISFFVLAYLIMYVVLFSFIYFNPSSPLQPWSLAWFLAIFSPTFSALIVTAITGESRRSCACFPG